jgi:hypothetical protein
MYKTAFRHVRAGQPIDLVGAAQLPKKKAKKSAPPFSTSKGARKRGRIMKPCPFCGVLVAQAKMPVHVSFVHPKIAKSFYASFVFFAAFAAAINAFTFV